MERTVAQQVIKVENINFPTEDSPNEPSFEGVITSLFLPGKALMSFLLWPLCLYQGQPWWAFSFTGGITPLSLSDSLNEPYLLQAGSRFYFYWRQHPFVVVFLWRREHVFGHAFIFTGESLDELFSLKAWSSLYEFFFFWKRYHARKCDSIFTGDSLDEFSYLKAWSRLNFYWDGLATLSLFKGVFGKAAPSFHIFLFF